MKKNAGILTAMAAVLAFFGLSNMPKDSTVVVPKTLDRKTDNAVSKGKRTAQSTAIRPPCEEIRERLQSIVADYPDQSWRAPCVCYENSNAVLPQSLFAENVEFVIATVPNPISTHLPLLFDRTIEIIQQAAQDDRYSYDSSWFPWNESKDYSRFQDQIASDAAQDFEETQPGILVFRLPPEKAKGLAYKGGLVIFVVSELPTGGINQKQFENAVDWIDQLGGLSEGRQLEILGPTFSGSLPSLYRSLNFERATSRLSKSTQIRISSGTVSSDDEYHWFKDKFTEEGLGAFDTFMEGDGVLFQRFCEYIETQGYETKHVAVLSEDETAFGGGVERRPNNGAGNCFGEPEGPTYLYYPRDIATLRSAYEQQSILQPQRASSDVTSGSTTLRGDLSEPANSKHDTVRSYGGQLTPLAQESVLLGITDILRERRIEFVVLRSTNSLDQIFLSQFLRRSFPEARVVIDGADLLFRRGNEGSSLRGVMVLSSYPLLVWQQDWTSSRSSGWMARNGQSYRIFGEDTAEGLYIAARGLFRDIGSTVPIANYAPPAWARTNGEGDDNRPAGWLTVVGHRQLWPLAVLNSHTLPQSSAKSVLKEASELKSSVMAIGGDPHPMDRVPLEFWILLMLCLAWALLHFLWCACASISPLPASFREAHFAAIPRWQHAALIGFGSSIIVAVAIVLAASSGLLYGKLDGRIGLFITGYVLTIAGLACSGCLANRNLPPMANVVFSNSNVRSSWKFALILSALMVLAFFVLHLKLLFLLTRANQISVFWRSMHLVNGVSPLLPQMFLLVGMYLWFWFCLRGLALFGNDRPLLPNETELSVMPMFSEEQAARPVESLAHPLGASYFKRLAMIFPLVLVVCRVALGGFWLRTLGERSFGVYVFFWISLLIAVIFTDTIQCWLAWRQLSMLLTYLDRLPLRRTLNSLQGLSWRSVWAMSGNVLAERYCLISRQTEALRHLGNQIDQGIPASTSIAEHQVWVVDRIRSCQRKTIPELVAWFEALNNKPVQCVEPLRKLQAEFASISACILSSILIPAWQRESDSLIFDHARSEDREGNGGPVVSANVPAYVISAEEFVVLPYVGFIQNILGRIRSMVFGILCLFVASTLAVSSYPFDPLPLLGAIFLAVFILCGTALVIIYAGMHRDATLSYITRTRAGELGFEFWRQLLTYGAGPLLGLMTTLFPSITDFIVSWLQPSTQLMK